jgi:hypothetical protein
LICHQAAARRPDPYHTPNDGFVGEGGAVFCPVCRCCTLKQIPKFNPSIFTQAEIISRGEEWTPAEEDLAWACSGGCTKSVRHA